jgi:hypothetical protein
VLSITSASAVSPSTRTYRNTDTHQYQPLKSLHNHECKKGG